MVNDSNRPLPVEAVELRRVRLELREPFGTAHGVEHERDILLVRVLTADGEGWGECVAPERPSYTAEHVAGATDVLQRFLAPALLAGRPSGIVGHHMAKAALEIAVLDAELRRTGTSLATHLGASRTVVDSGVAVGLTGDLDALVAEVGARVDEGYRRVKLKIEPGWDVEPVAAVRAAFPDLALQVDANGSYSVAEADNLAALDDHRLLLVEQPLPADDLLGHAELAGRLTTPICLDEGLPSVDVAATALALGACRVVNVKAGRVGGVAEARRLHDLCVDKGVPAWVGGMLETGLGRAVNVALAALPGFTLPGDLSASDRYWHQDLTEPFVLDDGRLHVPTGPGLGVAPLPDVLASRDDLDPARPTVTQRRVELR